MKILITGATGLIGKELVKQCLEKGYQVHYLTTSREKIEKTKYLQGFYWSPAKNEIDPSCFHGVEAVINLAGAPIAKKWTAAYKKTIVQSRTESLQLLHAAITSVPEPSIKSMVTASAIGIYPSSYIHVYKEDYPGADASFLGNTVAEWEKAAEPLGENGIPLAKIRVGLVLSGKGGIFPSLVRSVNYFAGTSFCGGNQWQSWIHLTDIARLFLFAAENRLQGVYNGVAPDPVTQKNLLRETASLLKKPLWLPSIPKNVLQLFMGERSSLLCSSQKVSAEKIVQKGFHFHYKTLRPALRDLL